MDSKRPHHHASPGSAERQLGKKRRPVWQRDYWDRHIRNEKHFYRTIGYIHKNPVKAGLIAEPELYRWSSAAQWAKGLDRE